MKNRFGILFFITAIILVLLISLCGCQTETSQGNAYSYTTEVFSLERNGIALHLDRTTVNGENAEKQILLTHGVTYSSHEFDIDYEDYSLVRFLARNGYAVWRLDIAGFGQSGTVADGFLPDSDYAADDIDAAVEKIVAVSGKGKIDLLGWSWGTVTASRYVEKRSDRINRLVLYAPILSGLGEYEVTEDFHHNTWEHAADDFQRDVKGNFDYAVTDPVLIELFCSSCWRYDGESSPNGGRRDICVSNGTRLIDLSAINVPTLVVCGDNDPYLDDALVDSSLESLPAGSEKTVVSGGAHVLMYEKPYYHAFQNAVIGFLSK